MNKTRAASPKAQAMEIARHGAERCKGCMLRLLLGLAASDMVSGAASATCSDEGVSRAAAVSSCVFAHSVATFTRDPNTKRSCS